MNRAGPSDHVCAGSFRRGRCQPHIGWMRVLVIYCHPVAESFAASAHAVVLEALAERGHEVTDVDLYAEQFDPVMSRQERLDYQNTARNERLVKRYDDQIATTEAIVLVYPAWWVRDAGDAEGIFRPRLAAWCGVRRVAGRHGQHGSVEEHPADHGRHDVWRIVVDGAGRAR